MKIINYSEEIELLKEIRDKAIHLELEVKDKLTNKFQNEEKAVPSLARQLPYVLWALNGDLKGKKIIDLGCGSISCHDIPNVDYEPWLCRLLFELGINVMGIDINESLQQEDFPNKVIDLFHPESLSFIPNNSIDLIHAASLFDSPTLLQKHGLKAGEMLLQILKPQLRRIIKEEGVLLIS